MHVDLQELITQQITRFQERVAQGYEVPAWILPEPSCEFLEKLGQYLGPEARAFEFGSGTSTVTLRRLFSSVTSLEDSPEWLEKIEQLPDIVPKRGEDATRAVSLTRCYLGLMPYHSFNLDKRVELLGRLGTADLILIDSPPNPATREHVLITALQSAKVGSLILIDDLEVRATRRFTERLARDNPQLVEYFDVPIDHMLGLYRKRAMGHIEHRPSLREVVGTWLRR